MNVDIWIAYLRQDPEAIHSFHNYLQSLTSESSQQFKTAKSMEQVAKLQGSIESLERILRDFNKDPRQEMEHARRSSKT